MNSQAIVKAFGGRLVGNAYMKAMVSKAVSKLPGDISNHLIHSTWFLSSDEDSWGYAFNGNDLKGKHLIFLSDVLFDQGETQIIFTILHEIGHIILGHKNSIGYIQTKEEIKLQESEADQFAKKYLLP